MRRQFQDDFAIAFAGEPEFQEPGEIRIRPFRPWDVGASSIRGIRALAGGLVCDTNDTAPATLLLRRWTGRHGARSRRKAELLSKRGEQACRGRRLDEFAPVHGARVIAWGGRVVAWDLCDR